VTPPAVHVSEAWVEEPLRRFVDEARLLYALLVHPSGRVLGQHGFTRAVDVMSASALAAAIGASSRALGKELGDPSFLELSHGGRERQLMLASAEAPSGPGLVLAVFDGATSLGLVRLYCQELRAALAAAAPPAPPPPPPLDLERELGRSLAALFGRAPVAAGAGARGPGTGEGRAGDEPELRSRRRGPPPA
jgi:hypothetical protein